MLIGMKKPASFGGIAFNPVPESENRIHADDVARAYGFRGGLVPGVVVSAYLTHPAAVAWGREWLDHGRAHVTVSSPVYDAEPFRVEIEESDDTRYAAHLIDPRGVHCARASVERHAAEPADPPKRRNDPLLDPEVERPRVSRAVMEGLRRDGLRALPARWNEQAEVTHYLRDPACMAPIYRESGCANTGFVLGLTNWILGRNVKMDAWLHLETWSEHFCAIAPDTKLIVEAQIVDPVREEGP